MMITEIPLFEDGTYSKPCQLFKEIMIGAIHCTGHNEIGLKKCKFCISYKEENFYILPISKQKINIVSEVICNRTGIQTQLF